MLKKTVYLGLSVDTLHHGHINLIKHGLKYGKIMVGLISDKAIAENKRLPILNYQQRKLIIENIKGVSEVVNQNNWDYSVNIKKYKPEYMIHGDDWLQGPILKLRKKAQRAGLLVHTFWILGFPGETYKEMQQTVDFALKSGSDSFSFAILQPLAGTPLYRKVWKENLWWEGREKYNNFRNSLIKVDGFDNPEDFEKWVHELNIKANLILKEKDPKKFEWKYGKKATERDLMRQT